MAELFCDAETVVGFCARFEGPEFAAAAELLKAVAGQDHDGPIRHNTSRGLSL